jgi:2'-5' RNA ligase
MANQKTKRLFIAINLPQEIKQELVALEGEIKNSFSEEIGEHVAKWVEPENLHITLLFIGEVGEDKVEKISQIIQDSVGCWQKFEVKMDKICYGPPKAMPPRLIWLEIVKNMDLECLAQTISQKAIEGDILRQADSRPFSPHITLARIKEWVWKRIEPEERPQVEQEIDLSFRADSVDLMESVLKRTGPEYAIVQSFPLS